MITSRLLFLSTYGTNMNFEDLIKNHSLGDNVNYVRFSILVWIVIVMLTSAATEPAFKAVSQIRKTTIIANG